ncbi:lysylphosphatidylglycerol synthase transmembrane domain-containing protein [Engelhardtia mirabilis]|uniref:Flippase-like domain-containing protein n=1 Tax=Engelhardtia mirabilis TaxID=2528011 RepID=A0A518BKM7_9BACT|nr:hypothetical protein Pla133_26090 [Planctomycetes bacterium Pla133]QDV01848.1 hypothetical protein Pla86_26080 [Planctomycetes bacterium Pla86]
MSQPATGAKRWLRWAQPIVGALILAFVASRLPWSDQLVLTAADKTEHVLAGELEGDWKAGDGDGVVATFRPTERPGSLGTPWSPQAAYELTWTGERWEAQGQPVELRPSMPRVFADLNPYGLLVAMGCFFVALICGVTRWWRLLNLAGCVVRWWDTFRLTFLGLFFNMVVPGLTGGDLIKAVLVVRENPKKRADALVSVFVDRILGLGTLAALAAVVIFVIGGPFAPLKTPISVVLAIMVLGALTYVNPTLRRLVRFDALMAKLPLGEKFKQLDDAVVFYTGHPLELLFAIALSLGNHFGAISGVMALSIAFGMPLAAIGFWDYVAIVPVANIVSSLPIAPGGWGLGEAVYGYLYKLMGQSIAIGVAVSVTFRLCQILLGLIGGLYLLRPGASDEVHQAEAELL